MEWWQLPARPIAVTRPSLTGRFRRRFPSTWFPPVSTSVHPAFLAAPTTSNAPQPSPAPGAPSTHGPLLGPASSNTSTPTGPPPPRSIARPSHESIPRYSESCVGLRAMVTEAATALFCPKIFQNAWHDRAAENALDQ